MPRDNDPTSTEPLPFNPPVPRDDGPTPEQIASAARTALMDALRQLDNQGTPLANLLALQALKRPDLLLKAMGKFSPNQAKQDLLPTIQAMHLAALRALASQPVLIEGQATPVAETDWLA